MLAVCLSTEADQAHCTHFDVTSPAAGDQHCSRQVFVRSHSSVAVRHLHHEGRFPGSNMSPPQNLSFLLQGICCGEGEAARGAAWTGQAWECPWAA